MSHRVDHEQGGNLKTTYGVGVDGAARQTEGCRPCAEDAPIDAVGATG